MVRDTILSNCGQPLAKIKGLTVPYVFVTFSGKLGLVDYFHG